MLSIVVPLPTAVADIVKPKAILSDFAASDNHEWQPRGLLLLGVAT